jgi:hypothetical protein
MYIATKELSGTQGRLGTGGLDAEEHVDLYEKLYQRFWGTVEKWYETAVEKEKPLEFNTTTQDMWELLKRGWVHTDDYTGGYGFRIRHGATGLCYPTPLETNEEAEEVRSKFGVPTTTIE